MEATFDQYEKYLDHDKKEYTAQLISFVGVPIDTKIKQARIAFSNIVARCKRHPKYKGLPVGFTAKQFAYWWIVQNRFFKIENPTVGRIDHSKGYTFDNIELQSLSDNSKEARKRCGTSIKPHPVKMIKNGSHIATVPSLRLAAIYSQLDLKSVQNVIRGKLKQSKGWSFELTDGNI